MLLLKLIQMAVVTGKKWLMVIGLFEINVCVLNYSILHCVLVDYTTSPFPQTFVRPWNRAYSTPEDTFMPPKVPLSLSLTLVLPQRPKCCW